MEKIHVSTPEAPLFLRKAERLISEYVLGKGKCPDAWSDLDITFVNGPYRLTDEGIRPTQDTGSRWQPKKSNYTYVLSHSGDRTSCKVLAINDAGEAEYMIGLGMKDAKRLP